jgi:hypothetical protein
MLSMFAQTYELMRHTVRPNHALQRTRRERRRCNRCAPCAGQVSLVVMRLSHEAS